MTVRNIPPLQSVTAVGATSTILTTFSGGLYSRGAGSNSTRLGGVTVTTGGTSSIGIGDAVDAQGNRDIIIGQSSISKNTGGNAFSQNIAFGYFQDIDNLDATAAGNNLGIGTGQTIRGIANTVLGISCSIASSAVIAGNQSSQNILCAYVGQIGLRSDRNLAMGNQPIVDNDVLDSVILGNSSRASHSNAILIGPSLTSTVANDFQLGSSSALYKFAGLFPNNNSVDFGTSRSASIYHDGTNFIVNPQLAGAGYLAVGPTGNFDLKVNKIGIAGQAPGGAVINGGTITSSTTTSLFNATLVYTGTSGSLRAMQFILTASNTGGTAPSPASFCVTNMNCDLAGNGQATGFLGQASIGAATTLATMTSCSLIGINAQISGNANSHTANLIIKSVRAADPGAYTTSGTLNSWALLCEGDGGIVTDKKWYWENSTTAKGDSYYTFNSASTDLDHYIDNTKVMTEDNDLIETFVPFKVAGVTLGASVHTITTPATNDDPIEVVQQNRVATTDATVTTLDTYTIAASTTVFIVTTVVARRTGGAAGTAEDGAGYEFATTIKNVAGTATIIAGPTATYTHESQAAFAATHDVNAATVRVRVTGVVNNNITWHSTSRIYQVGS